MASKEASSPLPRKDGPGDESRLRAWQMAWIRRHSERLEGMSTMDIADQLTEKGRLKEQADIYQKIDSQATIPNERARLLLGFIATQSSACFWDFQEALAADIACAYLALARKDEQVVAESFSAEELTAAFYSAWEDGRPASVVTVNKKLKGRYRALKMPSLDVEAGRKPVSLDEIRVNICLLSADKLDALCGSPGQSQPFELDSLKEKASSVITLEGLFPKQAANEAADLLMAAGIAGSGKSTAFTLKAAFEWAKVDCDEPFWELFVLFFTGSLTDPTWWKAKDLVEVFGLGRFGLTEVEQKEVVAYMCDHSEEVLLVADSLDEAHVDTDSLLWRILCGKCQDLPKLHVIICSRPCEKTLWLTKHCLLSRRLEVVGFTEEKIGQFIEAFFNQSPEKASELQAQLASRPDARLLMHTPLLATMICRLFQLEKALPSTQTGVYQSAILAMLQQTTERDLEREIPDSILDELSPPALQTAVESLCKLAFEGLAKKKAVFKKSELRAAGCLGTAVQLGFLSSTPSVSIAGRGQDAYSFLHHTMLEFFAAVHAVRICVSRERQKVSDLVSYLGVDGDFARFWPFFGGLLSAEDCELLLSALASVVEASIGRAHQTTTSQHLLLLLQCHMECLDKLPREGSPSVAVMLRSIGLRFNITHLTVSDARATAKILRQYSAVVDVFSLHDSSIVDGGLADVLHGLQECSKLRRIDLGIMNRLGGAAPALRQVLVRNKDSLQSITLPVTDADLLEILPVIKTLSRLSALTCGSRRLTKISMAGIAEVLRLLPKVNNVGIMSEMDDSGFTDLVATLNGMATRLRALKFYQTRLSASLLSKMLSSLPNLSTFTLVGNPIGDDDFRLVATSLQQLGALSNLNLCDIGLTWKSMREFESILLSCPMVNILRVYCQKRSFLPTGEGVDTIRRLTSMKECDTLKDSYTEYGYRYSSILVFKNDRQQWLFVHLLD